MYLIAAFIYVIHYFAIPIMKLYRVFQFCYSYCGTKLFPDTSTVSQRYQMLLGVFLQYCRPKHSITRSIFIIKLLWYYSQYHNIMGNMGLLGPPILLWNFNFLSSVCLDQDHKNKKRVFIQLCFIPLHFVSFQILGPVGTTILNTPLWIPRGLEVWVVFDLCFITCQSKRWFIFRCHCTL